MQNSEKLCLQWNNFKENLNLAFGRFRSDEDFADVTLACEDGTQIMTHRVILASSSPFFMDMLKKNKHPHPLIYMRGLKAEDLVAMVDFLYYGEANVNQESLDAFLGLAEELKLKGLTGSITEGNDMEFKGKGIPPENGIKERKQGREAILHAPPPFNVRSSKPQSENSSVALVSEEAHQLDEEIKSMMTRVEGKMIQRSSVYLCNVCGKEDKISNIKTHIEANHMASNIDHSCDICGKISRSRNGLRLHKAKEHFKQISLQDQGRLEIPQI